MSYRSQANKIIEKHVIWSLGGGLIPIPLVDFAAVTAIQVDMLGQLANLYGVKYTESNGKKLVVALTGTTLAKIGSSFLKVIPGFGSVIGGVSMAILSGASTYAVGQVAIQQFELGNDIFNIDIDIAQETYSEEFEIGKKVASDLNKNKDNSKNQEDSEDVYEALTKLGKLRDLGVITEEEFQEKKQILLAKI